ncbi:MAG TPA: hypothetical protein PKZ41_02010 [Candidatus Omnitrophota bacterium]|nr:hypothetical protein [Candidatus Omnitrophota bacterium]
MFTRIAGIIVMLFGLSGVINPLWFKNRVVRKINFRIRFVVYAFVLVFAVLILAHAARAEGLAAKVAAMAGLVITIKIIMLITTKSGEKISAMLEGKALNFFRIWAGVFLAMGMMLFFS